MTHRSEPRTLLLQPPSRVIDGPGAAARLPMILAGFGARRALVITGPTVAAETSLLWYLEQLLGEWHAASYSGADGSAGPASAAECVELARYTAADVLVSVGGGRAIDLAKTVAGALSDGAPPMRQIAIPTTLAGAAFTSRSLIGDGQGENLDSPESAHGRPVDVALLDPRLTVETPWPLWQSSGAATLHHAERQRATTVRHPLTDALARDASRRLRWALSQSAADPNALPPRGDAQLAAMMAYTGWIEPAAGEEPDSGGSPNRRKRAKTG